MPDTKEAVLPANRAKIHAKKYLNNNKFMNINDLAFLLLLSGVENKRKKIEVLICFRKLEKEMKCIILLILPLK